MDKETKCSKIIKSYPYKDLRCSRSCVHNYYRFNQQPPPYLLCKCCLPKL